VGSRGAVDPLPPTGHGPPRFRKTIPDWLHPERLHPDGLHPDGLHPDGPHDDAKKP
jgi:hypothetical protein